MRQIVYLLNPGGKKKIKEVYRREFHSKTLFPALGDNIYIPGEGYMKVYDIYIIKPRNNMYIVCKKYPSNKVPKVIIESEL